MGMKDSSPDEIARIRKMISIYGVNETARRTGRSHSNISHIKSGKRHAKTAVVTIGDLGLRWGSGKKCRRCGNPTPVVTISHVCPTCELIELHKTGAIKIEDLSNAG